VSAARAGDDPCVPSRKPLSVEDKLAALRKADGAHRWQSLDDRCSCILCERTFSGRQVEASVTRLGKVQLHCPTEGCPSTPEEWVYPGNPLVSQKAWRDWERVLSNRKRNHEIGHAGGFGNAIPV
jgi:hypothetical protein